MLHAWHRQRAALGAAGIGTWHLDIESQIASCDDSLNRIFGLNGTGDTEAPLETHLRRVHQDDRERVRATLERAISTNSEFTVDFRVVRPDGACRWLRDRGAIVTDDDGRPIVATGAVTDVTEARRLEDLDRMLAYATHALATSLDYQATLAVLTGSLIPRFAACRVHLQYEDEVTTIGAGADALAPSDGQVADATRTATPFADGRLLLLPLRTAGAAFGAMSFVSQGPPFDEADIVFANELATRVALSVERARLVRDLQRANHLKDEFLATLSHELRTPLNAVLGWTRMLRRGVVPRERRPRVLETIERNASAQLQLVDELLDLSTMVAGELRLNVTRVDLRELIGGAVETVRPAADAKGLRISLSVENGAREIAADPSRLRQVLWNLLSNAVKFTPSSGSIDITVAEGPAGVEIRIRDTGQGIPSEFLSHVFEPFRQADAGPTRTAVGLGLGLAIVRHLVEAHKGTVTARSDGPDLGATFTVTLPTARPSPNDEPSGPAPLRGRRVLAVDDDESTQELVATMLLMYGVSVRTAGRAEQALLILSEWRPDVIVTDIAMPGEDGYALMRRVRAMPSPLGGTPAVALTAYTDPQSVQNAFASGFDAHLGKPLEPHVLADALSKVLRLRQ